MISMMTSDGHLKGVSFKFFFVLMYDECSHSFRAHYGSFPFGSFLTVLGENKFLIECAIRTDRCFSYKNN